VSSCEPRSSCIPLNRRSSSPLARFPLVELLVVIGIIAVLIATPCAFGLNIEVSGQNAPKFRNSAEMIVARDAPEQLLDGNGDWLTHWERTGPDSWFRRGQNIWQWRDPTLSWYINGAGIREYFRHNHATITRATSSGSMGTSAVSTSRSGLRSRAHGTPARATVSDALANYRTSDTPSRNADVDSLYSSRLSPKPLKYWA